jgi:hypothetical protein
VRAIRTDRVTIAATGATGGASAPAGVPRGLLISAQTSPAYVTFDGTIPGATTGHYIPVQQLPVYVPAGVSTRVVGVSTAAATGAALDITWIGD